MLCSHGSFFQSPLGAFRNIWEQIWIGEALRCCLANPPIFSKHRKPEQTGIALDHVGSRASHGRVTQGRNSCVLFPHTKAIFLFPLKIKSGGSLAIPADLSFRCACSCLPSPTHQGFDRTRLILGSMVRSKLIARRGGKACLSPSPYGRKLSRQLHRLKL